MLPTARPDYQNPHAAIVSEVFGKRAYGSQNGHVTLRCSTVEGFGRWNHPDRKGGVWSVAEVKIQEGESIESALRRFKRKVQQEDIIKDIKKHSFYLKPGDKRRAKQALARKRSRKKQRREGE